jgi:hypothetical protein
MYINLGSLKVPMASAEEKKMTSMITGARDWRRDGIVHKKNEVFIDVLESVNLLVSATGAVLRNDVTGQVMMRSQLSGMPECKLGLNDKLVLDRDAGGGAAKAGAGGAGGRKKASGVELDDVQFHRCVQLGKFDADRTITFVPPDGDFELMKYRIADSVNLPFRLIPVIEEQGKTRVVMNVKAIANFSSQLFATNVTFKIPVCGRDCCFPCSACARGKRRRLVPLRRWGRPTPLHFPFAPSPCLAGAQQHGALQDYGGHGHSQIRAGAERDRVEGAALPRRAGGGAERRDRADHVHQEQGVAAAAYRSGLPGAHVHGVRPARAQPQDLRALQLPDHQVGALRHAGGLLSGAHLSAGVAHPAPAARNADTDSTARHGRVSVGNPRATGAAAVGHKAAAVLAGDSEVRSRLPGRAPVFSLCHDAPAGFIFHFSLCDRLLGGIYLETWKRWCLEERAVIESSFDRCAALHLERIRKFKSPLSSSIC